MGANTPFSVVSECYDAWLDDDGLTVNDLNVLIVPEGTVPMTGKAVGWFATARRDGFGPGEWPGVNRLQILGRAAKQQASAHPVQSEAT